MLQLGECIVYRGLRQVGIPARDRINIEVDRQSSEYQYTGLPDLPCIYQGISLGQRQETPEPLVGLQNRLVPPHLLAQLQHYILEPDDLVKTVLHPLTETLIDLRNRALSSRDDSWEILDYVPSFLLQSCLQAGPLVPQFLDLTPESCQFLIGLVCSGHCGKALVGQAAKGGQFSYYVCGTLNKKGAGSCPASYINSTRFENPVIDKVRQ